MLGSRDGEIAAVTGVQRVGGGIEQVTAECDGQREHHGVPCTKEVHRCVLTEAALGGGDDVHEVAKAVVVHQRDDRADGEHVETRRVRGAGGLLAEVEMCRPLYRCRDEHLPGVDGLCEFQSLLGGLPLRLGALTAHVRRGRDVHRCPDVRADVVLELQNLLGRHRDVAVLGQLEGAGVGHNRPREVE